jgi:hypothetical protein
MQFTFSKDRNVGVGVDRKGVKKEIFYSTYYYNWVISIAWYVMTTQG